MRNSDQIWSILKRFFGGCEVTFQKTYDYVPNVSSSVTISSYINKYHPTKPIIPVNPTHVNQMANDGILIADSKNDETNETHYVLNKTFERDYFQNGKIRKGSDLDRVLSRYDEIVNELVETARNYLIDKIIEDDQG